MQPFRVLVYVLTFLAAWQSVLGRCDDLKIIDGGTVVVKVYFTDTQIARDRDCGAVRSVERTVAKGRDMPGATLLELFKGVEKTESASGVSSPFVTNLAQYFRGIDIAKGTAIVKFDEGAMRYLNEAICIQSSVKSSIEKTLMQFPEIKRVQYSINDEIREEWDA